MVRRVLAAPWVLEDLLILSVLENPVIPEVRLTLVALAAPDPPLALGALAAPDPPLALGALAIPDPPLALGALAGRYRPLALGALAGRYRPLALGRPEFPEVLEVRGVPLVLGWDQARYSIRRQRRVLVQCQQKLR